MAVTGISGSGSASSSNSRTTIADNFDTFLQLLTTQLKNQNPLDPMDTNAFTQQLVQFTSVEQQLKTNDFLEAMMLNGQNANASQAVGYIGKDITASGVKSELSNGKATWMFDLAQNSNVTVTIKDQSGNVVYTEQGKLPAGKGAFNWDGATSGGTKAPAGTYSINIDARDDNGGFVAAKTETTGRVTGVDLTGSEPVLLMGQARVNLSSVSSVIAAN